MKALSVSLSEKRECNSPQSLFGLFEFWKPSFGAKLGFGKVTDGRWIRRSLREIQDVSIPRSACRLGPARLVLLLGCSAALAAVASTAVEALERATGRSRSSVGCSRTDSRERVVECGVPACASRCRWPRLPLRCCAAARRPRAVLARRRLGRLARELRGDHTHLCVHTA